MVQKWSGGGRWVGTHSFRDEMAVHYFTGTISRHTERHPREDPKFLLDHGFKVAQLLGGLALDVIVVAEGLADFRRELLVHFRVAAEVVGYAREGRCDRLRTGKHHHAGVRLHLVGRNPLGFFVLEDLGHEVFSACNGVHTSVGSSV